mmetsp:Transcript_12876/g.27335  ORF Transcript_12876/g.27335 Transcript_12876/m.27335 type:complete len:465 (+) Transcript_12876:87-1481(+)
MMATLSSVLFLSPWSSCLVALAFQARQPPSSYHRIEVTSLQSYLATSIDISESAPRNVASLYSWAGDYGIQTTPGFELASDDGLDVYAITNQYLPADSPILCIPNELILSGRKAREELGGGSTENNPAEQTLINLETSEHMSEISKSISQFYLFLKVLKEYELGAESPWYPWLDSLPRYFSNGASMTDFCFGCLPPYAAQQALDERKRLENFIRALHDVPYISQDSKNNVALTTWAFSVVQTRYQEMEEDGDLCLAPMADFFNHGGAEGVDVYVTFDDDGNCYAYSTREVGAGEPLRLCYGDSTNPSQLLAKFGFLDESSPATFCKYIIHNPPAEIFDMGYPTGMLFYQNGGISNEVWDVLLYNELGKISLQEQQAFYQAHMMGDDATKQGYHNQYFSQTFAELQRHVNHILNEVEELGIGLETQVDQGKDRERHPRLPLLMRHNEFVKNTFELVQQNMDTMVS